MKSFNPYISVVAAGRNDNYGGDFLHRMQVFIDNLCELIAKYRLACEIIIIEWNPPQDRQKLKDALIRPKLLKFTKIRFIEVPEEFHKNFPNSDKIPVFESIAKNIGIRRARGDYILVTNPDIVFSASLIKFLAKKKLSKNNFYRADRWDVNKLIPPDLNVKERLRFCVKNSFRVHNIAGTFDRKFSMSFKDIARVKWREIKRLIQKFRGQQDKLYNNAAGDFIVMHRDWRHKLQGYPELHTYSHADTIALLIARYSGLQQIILPWKMCVFHQEHERALDYNDINRCTRPVTDYDFYYQEIEKMARSRKPLTFNNAAWGLGDKKLFETEF